MESKQRARPDGECTASVWREFAATRNAQR